MEEWRIVPGYERFSVTADGQVRRNEMLIERRGKGGRTYIYKWKPHHRNPRISNGYPCVSVSTGKVRKPVYVHRLVARAFVDDYRPGYHVNHINGIKTDNRAENLEWVPGPENVKHAWRIGLTGQYGENNPMAKLTWRKVEAIRRILNAGISPGTIALICDVSVTTIQKIKDGATWKIAMEKTNDVRSSEQYPVGGTNVRPSQ